MKELSKYTIFHEQDGRKYIYHQMSKALIKIDTELSDALSCNNLSILSQDIISFLEESGFIVNDIINESYKLI